MLEPKIKRSYQYLDQKLSGDCELIRPHMPCKDKAEYEERKIHVEKHLALMDNDIILMWISLWWIFWAKYLSEEKIWKNIVAAYMIAPPFDDSLPDEELAGWFELNDDISLITTQCNNVYFMFSEDDPIVPLSHADKFREKLPEAEFHIYHWYGHFWMSEFPEIVEMIKRDIK